MSFGNCSLAQDFETPHPSGVACHLPPLGKAIVPEIESFMRANCDYYLKSVDDLSDLLFK